MARIAIMVLGFALLMIGIVGVLTPIPFGLIFLVFSLLLLIPTSPGATEMVRRLRRRFKGVDHLMKLAINRSPAPYRRILRRTDVEPYSAYR